MKNRRKNKLKKVSRNQKSKPIPLPWEIWQAARLGLALAFEYEQSFIKSEKQIYVGASKADINLKYQEIYKPVLMMNEMRSEFNNRRDNLNENIWREYLFAGLSNIFRELNNDSIDNLVATRLVKNTFAKLISTTEIGNILKQINNGKAKKRPVSMARELTSEITFTSVKNLEKLLAVGPQKIPFGVDLAKADFLESTLKNIFSIEGQNVTPIVNKIIESQRRRS